MIQKKSPGIVLNNRNTRQKRQIFDFKCNLLALSTLLFVIVLLCCTLIRYVVMRGKTGSILVLLQGLRNSAEQYITLCAINLSLTEMYLYGNKTNLSFQSSEIYFREKRDYLSNHDIDLMKELSCFYKEPCRNQGDSTVLIKELISTKMDVILKSSEVSGENYVGYETAIAGIVMKPMINFLEQYVIISNQIYLDWAADSSLESRKELLRSDQFSSLLAYSIYNSIGTSDAIYFHMIYPLFTQADSKSSLIPNTIRLSNLISISVCIFLVVIIGIPTVVLFRESYSCIFLVIYTLPLSVFENNLLLMQALRNAKQRTSFGYF